jgi:hypothetical protein
MGNIRGQLPSARIGSIHAAWIYRRLYISWMRKSPKHISPVNPKAVPSSRGVWTKACGVILFGADGLAVKRRKRGRGEPIQDGHQP